MTAKRGGEAMASNTRELEGTWEEIQAHAAELAGRRVRVTVLPTPEELEQEAEERKKRALAWIDEMERNPLTEEEIAILDDMERFLKENRFTLTRKRNP
jgi:hypothetical protein